MKIYYTTPTAQDAIQTDPRLSLGGYKSANPVPNAVFDNLFGEISQYLLSKEIPEAEFIGVILKNETGVDAKNLQLWFEYGVDCYSKLLVSAVDLVADAAGVLRMEHIPSRNSTPLYADFYEANSVANAVEIGDLADGEMVGLWFQRQLVADLAKTIQADDKLYITDPNHTDMVMAVVPVKSDSILIKMEWPTFGDELVLNGGFDNGSSWALESGIAISDGLLNYTNADAEVTQDCLPLVSYGKTYRVIYTISNYSAGNFIVNLGGITVGSIRTADGTYQEDITISDSDVDSNSTIYLSGTGFTGSIDNISIKQIM